MVAGIKIVNFFHAHQGVYFTLMKASVATFFWLWCRKSPMPQKLPRLSQPTRFCA